MATVRRLLTRDDQPDVRLKAPAARLAYGASFRWVMRKTAPRGSLARHSTSQPCASTICWTTARPKPGALLLGREVRLEDFSAAFRGDPRAVVADFEHGFGGIALFGDHLDFAAAIHGLDGIEQ